MFKHLKWTAARHSCLCDCAALAHFSHASRQCQHAHHLFNVQLQCTYTHTHIHIHIHTRTHTPTYTRLPSHTLPPATQRPHLQMLMHRNVSVESKPLPTAVTFLEARRFFPRLLEKLTSYRIYGNNTGVLSAPGRCSECCPAEGVNADVSR